MRLSENELRALIRPGGESETLDYKEAPTEPKDFAKLLVAFSNTRGGRILVGVNDSGRIVGYSGAKFEEWVSSVARDKVDPPIRPEVEAYALPEGRVFVVEVPIGPDKPYARVHDNRRGYFVRVGTTVREASTEELQRLFQAGGKLKLDQFPIRGVSFRDIDEQPLRRYLKAVYRKDLVSLKPEDRRTWLTNLGFLDSRDGPATLAGVLLFAQAPEEHVPESRIAIGRFAGPDVASPLQDRQEIGGRLPDLVDDALRFIQGALRPAMRRKGGKLIRSAEIPAGALREAIVNAVVHRDYTLKGRMVRVPIFESHLEVRSPGRPPNTLTLERMKAGGTSDPRNGTLFLAMAHLKYVQNFGMGVRRMLEETRRAGRPAEILVDVEETVVRFPRKS